MDYNKLLGVKTSPKENFEKFYKEMAAKIENEANYEIKWKLADLAISFCDQEIPRPPDVPNDPTSYYDWDSKRQKFSDLKNYYREEHMLKSQNGMKENIVDPAKSSGKRILWSGSKRELLELVYSLKYAGLIDGFETNEGLREAFAERMGFELKYADNSLTDMPKRNADMYDDKSKFLKKLDSGWKKYCSEKQSNKVKEVKKEK